MEANLVHQPSVLPGVYLGHVKNKFFCTDDYAKVKNKKIRLWGTMRLGILQRRLLSRSSCEKVDSGHSMHRSVLLSMSRTCNFIFFPSVFYMIRAFTLRHVKKTAKKKKKLGGWNMLHVDDSRKDKAKVSGSKTPEIVFTRPSLLRLLGSSLIGCAKNTSSN